MIARAAEHPCDRLRAVLSGKTQRRGRRCRAGLAPTPAGEAGVIPNAKKAGAVLAWTACPDSDSRGCGLPREIRDALKSR